MRLLGAVSEAVAVAVQKGEGAMLVKIFSGQVQVLALQEQNWFLGEQSPLLPPSQPP